MRGYSYIEFVKKYLSKKFLLTSSIALIIAASDVPASAVAVREIALLEESAAFLQMLILLSHS